jgi:hypothetical protein
MNFCSLLEKIEFNNSAVASPKGGREIVLNTGYHDIQFTFSFYEFEELKDLLQQAKVILEAEQILKETEN